MLLIEAGNQRAVSSSDLARLIGMDVLGPSLDPTADLEAPPAPATLEDARALITQARSVRPERRALEQRIQAGEEQVAAARAGALPTIAVVSGFDYARPNPRIFPRAGRWDESWDAGVNVSWNLWDGGRTGGTRRVAQADSLVTSHAGASMSSIPLSPSRCVNGNSRSIPAVPPSAPHDAVSALPKLGVLWPSLPGRRGHADGSARRGFALLQSELDRTRAQAGVRLAEARLAAIARTMNASTFRHLTRRFGEFCRGQRSDIRRAEG